MLHMAMQHVAIDVSMRVTTGWNARIDSDTIPAICCVVFIRHIGEEHVIRELDAMLASIL